MSLLTLEQAEAEIRNLPRERLNAAYTYLNNKTNDVDVRHEVDGYLRLLGIVEERLEREISHGAFIDLSGISLTDS